VIMLILVILIFMILSPAFLSFENIQVILHMLPEFGILVIGVTLLMISGEFDLSVGSVFAFTPILNGLLLNSHWNPNWMFAVGGSPRAVRGAGNRPGLGENRQLHHRIVPCWPGRDDPVPAPGGVGALVRYVSGAGCHCELRHRGAVLAGGAGYVLGSDIGSVLIRIMDVGLVFAGAPSYWFRVFVGLLLVVSVAFNRAVESRLEKMR
jgi:ribose/xylose/arabinose/galactoside ABC-type transport system permease subunit